MQFTHVHNESQTIPAHDQPGVRQQGSAGRLSELE
jgi:hypothetical protein